MQDVSLIRLLDVLSVNGIAEAHGIHPRTIYVRGIDFRSVETVLINGLGAPEFRVMSTSELLAQVPESLVDAIITDVMVLSSALTMTASSIVEFTTGEHLKFVEGIQKLMQTYLRQLMRTPGTNIFHPRSGGGLRRRIGTIMDESLAGDIAVAVSQAQQYIINVQAGDRTIPPSERLLAAEISNLQIDQASTSCAVGIVLTNHAGTRAAAEVMVTSG